MNSLISRLQRPGYDLQKEQAIQEVVVELRRLNAERDECNRRRLEAADHFAAQTALMKKKYDDLRAKVEAAEKWRDNANAAAPGGQTMTEITHQLLWSPQPNDEHKLVFAECERVLKLGGTFKIENRHMETWYSIITIYYPEAKP